jgi:hypothetical protein
MNSPEERDDPPADASFAELLEAFQEVTQAGRLGEADALAGKALDLAAQQVRKDPSPELPLLMQAQRCEAAADWKGAEVAYREVLDRAVHTGEAASQYRALSGLACLCQLVGDDPAALEQARSATDAARRADMPVLLAVALEQQAGCALRLVLVAEARTALDEALRCLGSERWYDVQRGRCLVLRAECGLRSGDLAAAERDLEAARKHLEVPSGMEMAAGVHSAVARWWSVKARLQAEHGDPRGASQAWARAVAGRRHVAELPHVQGPYVQNALAETLWAQGRATLSAGLPEEAGGPLAESRAIREQIGLPRLAAESEPEADRPGG